MNIAVILAIAYLTGETTITENSYNKIIDSYIYPTMQFTIGIETAYKLLGFSAITDTIVVPHNPVAYSPYHASYKTDLYVKTKWVRAGWEHRCEHPILSYGLNDRVKYYEDYDKFYISTRIVLKGD